LLDRVKKIVKGLSVKPRIYPTAESVLLVYENKRHGYLEFEISEELEIPEGVLVFREYIDKVEEDGVILENRINLISRFNSYHS
jgi:hypothetical protein